ncbi:Leucine rich repeat N-terminal domain containing protein [Novymonas esmeraldas]|uniref:Leucine rich repeat N-terminal domain containing protein n=1 Tax=Novymonas esmeraldas TaxID=1808958 RepID=A0AAW0EWI4_9TRYP
MKTRKRRRPCIASALLLLLFAALVLGDAVLWLHPPLARAETASATATFLNEFRDRVEGFDFATAWPLSESDYCKWSGISCDEAGMVSLDLSNRGLRGRFPKLRDLDGEQIYLEAINMSFNPDFRDDLREDWGELAHLRSLDLSSTRVDGDLPDDWGSLHALQFLNLSSTGVSGDVPKEWAGMQSLVVLDLRRTEVGDDIHASVVGRGMVRLEVLQLGETTVRRALEQFQVAGLFPRLRHLNVSFSRSDRPTRRLPSRLAEWARSVPDLEYVNFDGYGFAGCVPESYHGVPALMQAARRANVALVSLQCGRYACANPADLDGATVSFLRLLRSALPTLSAVWTDVDPCQWKGITCPRSCGGGVHVDLSTLPISGPLDNIFAAVEGGMALIDSFVIRGNTGLVGSLPRSLLQALSLVRHLDFSSTALMGSLPPELAASLPYLEHLAIAGTYIGGSLPDWGIAAALPPLRHVDLSNNRMAGSLSGSWASLPLAVVKLQGNPFCGCIPPSWRQHSLLLSAVDQKALQACGVMGCAFLNSCGNHNQQFSDTRPPTPVEETRGFLMALARGFPGQLVSWGGSGNYCDGSWSGIACVGIADSVREVHINLTRQDLNGSLSQLPAHLIGARVLVASIDMSGNPKIQGRLPATWGRLSYLRTLILSGSRGLQSELPNEWEGMERLERLEIANSGLCRGFPEWHASKMPFLAHVDLRANWMVGGLSDSFGSFGQQLVSFDATGNGFCGCVPPSWPAKLRAGIAGDVANPTMCATRNACNGWKLVCGSTKYSSSIDLSDYNLIFLNQLRDAFRSQVSAAGNPAAYAVFSTWLGVNFCAGWRGVTCAFNSGRNGYTISLRGLGLVGELPAVQRVFSTLLAVRAIDLADNPGIVGTLPPTWSSMVHLRALSLRNTSVASSIPVSWQNMESLRALSLSDTSVCGSLPLWSADALVAAGVLDFSRTKLAGALTSEWGSFSTSNLSALHLQGNAHLCPCAPESWLDGGTLPSALVSAFGSFPTISSECASACAPPPSCVDPEDDGSGDATSEPRSTCLCSLFVLFILAVLLAW